MQYSNMGSESNHLSSQKSHKMFRDLNIFSVHAVNIRFCDFWPFNEHPLEHGSYFLC